MPHRTLNSQPRRGFVLVMALVLVGVAGLALAGLANRSMMLALEARSGQRVLQEKWATLSCQSQLLKDPERLLGDLAASFEAEQQGWPYPARIEGGCRLGGLDLRLTLADEEAKVNLNTLYDRRPQQLAAAIALAAQEARLSVPVLPRPATDPQAVRAKRFFSHWGQVIDLSRLSHPQGGDNLTSLVSLAGRLTCWGNRRLNVTRADDRSLETVARLVLNGPETQRLLEARAGFDGRVGDLVRLAEVPARKSARLRRLLTDRSGCHSLLVTIEHRGRNQLQWAVSEPARRGAPEIRIYQWP